MNKKGEGERAVINGHHDAQIFQSLLDDFIEKYVLCMECRLPEIDMLVSKKGLVKATCKACGWRGKLDNGHKLATYISKNPPSSGVGFADDKPDKPPKAAKPMTREEDGDHNATSDQSQTDHEAKNPAIETKGEVGGEDEAEEQQEDKGRKCEDESGQAKDTMPRKGKKEQKDQKEKKGKKTLGATASGSDRKESDEKEDEQEDEEDLRYDGRLMSGVVRECVELVEKSDNITVDKMYEEVRAQQVTRGFDNQLRMYVVVSALFPDGTLSAKGVKHRAKFIKAFITNGGLPFAAWIWGFEAYLAANPRATKAWAMTLKTLYDAELAEEEAILEYFKGQHDGPGFDASKKAAAPFIQWLEASEEGSDDDTVDEDR